MEILFKKKRKVRVYANRLKRNEFIESPTFFLIKHFAFLDLQNLFCVNILPYNYQRYHFV